MVDRNPPQASDPANTRHGFCLTDLSTGALIGGAVGASALLWLLIVAVL